MDIFKLSGNEVKVDGETYIVAFELSENKYVSPRQLKKYSGADVIIIEEWNHAYLDKEEDDYSKWWAGPRIYFDGYWFAIQKKDMNPLNVIAVHEVDYLTTVAKIM